MVKVFTFNCNDRDLLVIADRYVLHTLVTFCWFHCSHTCGTKFDKDNLSPSFFFLSDPLVSKNVVNWRLFRINRLVATCTGCQQAIHPLDLIMRVSDAIYHYTCFTCAHCTRMLQPGDQFLLRHGQLVCDQSVCQMRANNELQSSVASQISSLEEEKEQLMRSDQNRDDESKSLPFSLIQSLNQLGQMEKSASKIIPKEQVAILDYKNHCLSEFISNGVEKETGHSTMAHVCEQCPDTVDCKPLSELMVPPRDDLHLGSPHQFGFEFNPNPVTNKFFDFESESRPVSMPYPGTTSPSPRLHPISNESELNSTVISYPHSNRSPPLASVTSCSLGQLNTPHSLIPPIQNCLCPIPNMGPSRMCDDLAKLNSYSSFLPTSGISLIPSSPRIGPNPLLNASTGLLKLISPSPSMLYGQGPITSPNSGSLLLGQSSQRRNRKRRGGLHQNFGKFQFLPVCSRGNLLTQLEVKQKTWFKNDRLHETNRQLLILLAHNFRSCVFHLRRRIKREFVKLIPNRKNKPKIHCGYFNTGSQLWSLIIPRVLTNASI